MGLGLIISNDLFGPIIETVHHCDELHRSTVHQQGELMSKVAPGLVSEEEKDQSFLEQNKYLLKKRLVLFCFGQSFSFLPFALIISPVLVSPT
jgi:hypothetical protein